MDRARAPVLCLEPRRTCPSAVQGVCAQLAGPRKRPLRSLADMASSWVVTGGDRGARPGDRRAPCAGTGTSWQSTVTPMRWRGRTLTSRIKRGERRRGRRGCRAAGGGGRRTGRTPGRLGQQRRGVFRDASLHADPATEVLELVAVNLGMALTGCAVAVRRFLAAGNPGAIVNVSSHQAQRPVPGALPDATAKAAVEGLTRALAVDYGPSGIRTNAVALGHDRHRSVRGASSRSSRPSAMRCRSYIR